MGRGYLFRLLGYRKIVIPPGYTTYGIYITRRHGDTEICIGLAVNDNSQFLLKPSKIVLVNTQRLLDKLFRINRNQDLRVSVPPCDTKI